MVCFHLLCFTGMTPQTKPENHSQTTTTLRCQASPLSGGAQTHMPWHWVVIHQLIERGAMADQMRNNAGLSHWTLAEQNAEQ
jgi:hypothetical protein